MRTFTPNLVLKFISRLGLFILACATGALHAAGANGEQAEAKLASFFKSYLDASFAQQPLRASQLGDHRFDAELEDVSPASRQAWTSFAKQTLTDLPRQVDYQALTRAGQIDYEILEHELKAQIWLAENIRSFEEDPRTYGAYITDSIYLLFAQSTLPKETNVTHAIRRMAKIPAVIATARATLTHPPRVMTETAIKQNRGAIGFYETELFEMIGESPQLPQVKATAAPIVAALKEYQVFLENDLLPRATGDWRIGREKFGQKMEHDLFSGQSADEVLKDAEAEFARVRREMGVIARQLWSRYYPGQAFPPDDEPGRREAVAKVIAAVSQEHGKPEDLVGDARATVAKIKKFIAERDILRLPEPDRCQIVEMPEFKRGNSIAYLENAPPLDPSADSIYAVSPPPAEWPAARVKSFLEEYNRHMLQILTIHEAYPGHYVQLEYSNREPSLIRRVLQSGVFAEGWAVYTEQMMLDEGYGGGDLALRMMQLKFYLRAVGNTILDHKMHCTAMTDDEALHLLTVEAFQSEGEAKLKIIRSKQSSVQLSTYFVGRMAFYRNRQQVSRELGDKFSLGRYHEAAIGAGTLPVKYLPEVVRTQLGLKQ